MIILHILTSDHQPECNCGAAVGTYHAQWCDALKPADERDGEQLN